MKACKRILSHLASGAGRRLRTLSICLLGIAASISVHAFAPNTAAPAQPAPTRTLVQRAPRIHRTGLRFIAHRHSRRRHLVRTRVPRPIPTVTNAARVPFTHRIFVEGTAPPAGEVLTAFLQGPLNPNAVPLPASPAFSNTSASPSNRQRAP
jgi:hypothetical protein